MPKQAQPRKPFLLSTRTTNRIEEARTEARKGAKIVKVAAHERVCYRLKSKAVVRAAKWQAMESAMYQLASDIELHGSGENDEELAKRVKEWMHDVFGV